MSTSATTILAIETSCDETGVAVLRKQGESITVLSEALASQMDIHAATGGVVPEVAAREHVAVIQPMLKAVLAEAGIEKTDPSTSLGVDFQKPKIDAIAVTVGPGLQPALAVGVTMARTLSYAWEKPLIPVHHIEGHIYSALLEASLSEPTSYKLPPTSSFPALALIVSGGHTQLILVPDHVTYIVVGSTRDDAAGEAFDKVARLLELPYPGGPALSKLAEQGNPTAFDFPRPMLKNTSLDFSFSGLKTAVLYTLRDQGVRNPADKVPDTLRANIAASFQQAVVETLVKKTQQAIEQLQPKTLLLAGGVAANHLLRQQLGAIAENYQIPLRIAPLSLCGDNAVMIGLAGFLAHERGRRVTWQQIEPYARLALASMSTFPPPAPERSVK